jgi:hypothetical protein
MKNYRHFGDEIEILGNRLDHARACYAQAKQKSWAENYWRQVIDSLLFQWRQIPILHDGDAQGDIIPRWTVNYDFFEIGSMNEGDGVTDRVYHKFFRESVDIEASWHYARESRLSRAQY